VGVETSEEARHSREDVIFKHAPKAEWPEEVAQKLVLAHIVSSTERVPELL
jgi:hypothetical protein